MKVGIASCYYHHNYGSVLQAYATQIIIEKLGHEAITIVCKDPMIYMSQPKITYYFHKLMNFDIVKDKIRKLKSKIEIKKYSEIVEGIAIRDKCFDDFSNKFFKLSETSNTRKELSCFAQKCDAVIVGSDMLWHPINIEHDYYTLTFVPDEVKKISYATSFGTTVIPKYQKKKARDFLKRFNSISVREQSGINVVKQLGVDKDVQVVLDPTLLFTAKEWMHIQNEEKFISGKYILCYFLGVNTEHRKIVNLIKEVTGYKIVALQHLDEFVSADIEFADIKPYNVGPSEFLNLIRNAEIVCTDSFHGTCFSLLNHKKFFVFNRFQDNNTQSTNTRIDSLLKIVNLEDRRITAKTTEDNVLEQLKELINYEVVDECLEVERKKSLLFLENAFSL